MENMNEKNDSVVLYKLGAWSCVVLLAYTLATILIVTFIGGPPQSIDECFGMLKENRIDGTFDVPYK